MGPRLGVTAEEVRSVTQVGEAGNRSVGEGGDSHELDNMVPELREGKYIRHCADCRHARVRASLESKSGIEVFCSQGRWRDKSSHRKTFKRMLVVLAADNEYFRDTAVDCELFESMAQT